MSKNRSADDFRVGQVIRRTRPYAGGIRRRGPSARGIVSGFRDGDMLIRISAGHTVISDCWEDWTQVSRSQHTVGERVRSASMMFPSSPTTGNTERDSYEWHLMLQFLPPAEQDRILAYSTLPGFAQLALWVARWVDPESRTSFHRVADAIAWWRPDESWDPDHREQDFETLPWATWMAFLPPAIQQEVEAGSWPNFEDLAVMAGVEAQRQHKHLQTLKAAEQRAA